MADLNSRLNTPVSFCIRQGVEALWKVATSAHRRAMVFSPFVTAPLADEVLRHRAEAQFELYTSFSAKNFVARASCLDTLERLSRYMDVFEVQGLHAKILLIPGHLATVGSQNLTQKGTTNKEATVVIADPPLVREVERGVSGWVGCRVKITPERIAEMRRRVESLKDAWSTFDRLTREADDDERFRDRINRINRAVPSTAEAVEGEVKQDPKHPDSFRLYPRGGRMWRDLSLPDGLGTHVMGTLARTKRYMCVNQDRGTIGWLRYGETKISKVSSRFLWHYHVDIGGESAPAIVRAVWDDASLRTHNLVIEFDLSTGTCELHCVYDLSSLKVARCDWRPTDDNPTADTDIPDRLSNVHDPLHKQLIENITSPGDFPDDNKLDGAYANRFFGEIGTRVRLRVAEVAGSPVFVSDVVQWPNDSASPRSALS